MKIFILNNQYMGMVRQWQELTYESRYAESYSDSLPDFVKLGEAYCCTICRPELEKKAARELPSWVLVDFDFGPDADKIVSQVPLIGGNSTAP